MIAALMAAALAGQTLSADLRPSPNGGAYLSSRLAKSDKSRIWAMTVLMIGPEKAGLRRTNVAIGLFRSERSCRHAADWEAAHRPVGWIALEGDAACVLFQDVAP